MGGQRVVGQLVVDAAHPRLGAQEAAVDEVGEGRPGDPESLEDLAFLETQPPAVLADQAGLDRACAATALRPGTTSISRR